MGVRQAISHIDLNDQVVGRYDHGFPGFGAANPESRVRLVKFLEDAGCHEGPQHFDAHAYRTERLEGVMDLRAATWHVPDS